MEYLILYVVLSYAVMAPVLRRWLRNVNTVCVLFPSREERRLQAALLWWAAPLVFPVWLAKSVLFR